MKTSLLHNFSPGIEAKKRLRSNRAMYRLFVAGTVIPLALIVIITVVLAIRFWPILQQYSLVELISGTIWKPQKGLFGFWPFIAGTFWVSFLAVFIVVPPCLFTALYLAEYAHPTLRDLTKPLLDLLAAVPSVVYGVWGVLVIVPLVGDVIRPTLDQFLGGIPLFSSNQPTGFSILSASIVLAVMISPFIIAISYEVIATIPQGMREASLGLGATRWQTIWHVVLPQSAAGIFAGIILGATRALGETLAVLMVVGNVPQVPTSIFDSAYPLPALIANNYGEMMSIPLYDAALLGAALILLVIILFFNIISTIILQRILTRRGA